MTSSSVTALKLLVLFGLQQCPGFLFKLHIAELVRVEDLATFNALDVLHVLLTGNYTDSGMFARARHWIFSTLFAVGHLARLYLAFAQCPRGIFERFLTGAFSGRSIDCADVFCVENHSEVIACTRRCPAISGRTRDPSPFGTVQNIHSQFRIAP